MTNTLIPTPSQVKPALADIVISLNGRDKNKYFIVIETRDEYSLIADGKGRRIDKPKLKKNKHLKIMEKAQERIAEKLLADEKVTNSEIRKELAEYIVKTASNDP